MLRIEGSRRRYCDGVSRRSFLEIGAMSMGGLTLADLLRNEAAVAETVAAPSSHKALINIFLGGGPPHTDMFDLKPEAPADYRGELIPIGTNVPGMQICQLMPELAQMADKFSVVRSLTGSVGDHASYQCQSGFRQTDLAGSGGHPALGSVVASQFGSAGGAPAFVSMMGNVSPGYLGPVYQPYRPDGEGRRNLQLRSVSESRLRERTGLLRSIDRLRREADNSGAMEAMDAFTQRAVEVVTSGQVADALDLSKEDPKLVDRYRGGGSRSRDSERFLLARRLIEAGVRVVSLNWGGWDTHSNNFGSMREQLPPLSRGLSALISDLYERGRLDDVTIVMWGEFGRTPKVNGSAGRDHWPRVGSAFLAGGGMRGGQMIGTTDRLGGEAQDRPVHFREVFATLYHNLGIDVTKVQFEDNAGRPQYLVDNRKPIEELI
jgi:uncharacterized protein (DUF1501 family)